MSASVRPSIPRPRTSVSPAASTSSSLAPPAPAPPRPLPIDAKTASCPARECLPTLDLDDSDIVGVTVRPIKTGPPLPGVRTTTIPPAPASGVAVRDQAKIATAPDLDELERAWDEAAARIDAPSWALPAHAPESIAPTPALPAAPPVSVSPPPVSVSPPPVSSQQPSPAPPVLRLSAADPTDVIFDGIYGLTFARSTGEAAEMCAETLAKALRARAVVIHTHDLLSRELRVLGAHGEGDFDILGSAEPIDDDLVASAVICNERSVTMTFDGELPRLAPKRLHAVGAPRTLVAAPAMSWGRCLAIIEVIDADERYANRVADSAAYVAERFAQFLAAHAA
jgi:hypothetical protein